MSTMKWVTVAVGLVAFLSLGLTVALSEPVAPDWSTGKIANTPHGTIEQGYVGSDGTVVAPSANVEVCRPCHAPHLAQTSGYKIWNHTVDLSKGYKLYGSTGYTLDTSSRLCLSCHDGAIAVDSYGQNGPDETKGGNAVHMANDMRVGENADLTKDHPVGVVYPNATGTDTTGRWVSALAWTGNKPKLVGDTLSGTTNQVGCTTCHNAHKSVASYGKFLRVDNTGSSLCLMCHVK